MQLYPPRQETELQGKINKKKKVESTITTYNNLN